MGKHLKSEIMNPSKSHPSEPDYSKIENDKLTSTVISMSPEYSKYRDTLIICSVIFILFVLIGGIYLLTRHIEWSIPISVYNKAIEINPDFADTYFYRGVAYQNKGQFDKAISDYNKAIEINSEYAKTYNQLAWLLATCPDERYRNGVKAIELAEKALEIRKTNWFVDTLAAAYAEAGRFEDAIVTEEIAISLLKKEEPPENIIDEYMEHLNSYKANKPWREK